jgi:3-carboxy-cis,cis-muconate cycloisomerase
LSDQTRIDSGFSTSAMQSVFSPTATVEALVEFEVALAQALGDSGLAPEDEVVRLIAACRLPVADAQAVLAGTWEDGTPIVSLRDEICARVDERAGRWFHYGATTQDAIDTGLMLQCGRGLGLIDRDLVALGGRLRDLTIEFRGQPQMGRTFLQASRPTTFGLRTAWWLNSVLGHH